MKMEVITLYVWEVCSLNRSVADVYIYILPIDLEFDSRLVSIMAKRSVQFQ